MGYETQSWWISEGQWLCKREHDAYMPDEVVVVVNELDGKGLFFSLLCNHKNEVKHGGSTN